MSHTSSDANIQTEDTKQGVAASASSKGTLMKPLALAKSSSADPGLSLELLNLVIRNLIDIDAQSLGRLALASRLFAALTRSYRLGLLILTSDLDCYDYMAFCETTAPDAPSLVRELHLEQFCLLDDVNQSPTTKIVPIATDVRSLSLRGDAWGNLLVPGMICTARIDTLTLCQEFFTTMAEMEGFFGNMPSLKTVVLKDEVGIQESFDAPSGGAIKEGPEISELRLVKLYNSGEFMEHVITHATPFSLRNIKRLHIHCINHGLENFLYKVFQIPGDMEELVLTRPKPLFGFRRHLHVMDLTTWKKMRKRKTKSWTPSATHWVRHANVEVPRMWGLPSRSISPPQFQSASSSPGIRLKLLQFDLISGDDNTDDYFSDSTDDPAPTRLLRWLTSCFSQFHSPLSIGTIKINIYVDDDEVIYFVNDTLWREWDAQLARFESGPPDVHIDVKSVICEVEVEDQGEDGVPAIIGVREEALQNLRWCIERNMVHIETAGGLHISTAVCVEDA